MAVSTADEYVALAAQSRLLSEKQIQAVREYVARAERPTPLTVAQWLVNRGYLTVWQAQRLLAGKRQFFLGKYKFLEQIAEGAMGVVFKAEHALMGRTVAVKVLSKTRLSHPNAVARFGREVQAAAAVNHVNIVKAFDAGEVGSTHYLVMEYIAGADLDAWQARYQKVPIPWACEFIRQAALGLAHAHAQGLVHRDIKPANILVAWNEADNRPVVKLLDLGLARLSHESEEELAPSPDDTSFQLTAPESSDLTQAGTILGTPDYLAPEQILRNVEVDARTDVFCLGCTLFKILTGELPYSGPNLLGKLQARVAPAAPPAVRLRTFLPEADEKLEAIVARMVERDPAKRFQTAQEVADALAPYAEPPKETWEAYRSADKPQDSSEIGSSQMEVDPRLRDFLDKLVAEAPEVPAAEGGAAPGAVTAMLPPAAEGRTIVRPGREAPIEPPVSSLRLPRGGPAAAIPVATAPGPAAAVSTSSPSGDSVLQGDVRPAGPAVSSLRLPKMLPPISEPTAPAQGALVEPLVRVAPGLRRRQSPVWPLVLAGTALLLVLLVPVAAQLGPWFDEAATTGPGSGAAPAGQVLFVWHSAGAANEVSAAPGRSPRKCVVTPQGDAAIAADGRMSLAGQGRFEADDASSQLLWGHCTQTGEFALEARIETRGDQNAAIVAFGNKLANNFVLEQRGEWLWLWVRTSQSPGGLEVKLAQLEPGRPTHVVVAFAPGRLTSTVDGRESTLQLLTAGSDGSLKVWSAGVLMFGSAPFQPAPWRGTLSSVVIRDRAPAPSPEH
ncbi:MAG: protein kinase [Planctomycetia bacterium]|nr:protein kinase [Planctomycetia bacterium]